MNKQLLKILIVIIAIIYFVWPIDLIPDFIPVLGMIDDLIIGAGAIWFFLKR